jgi:hypothetical protein
MYQLQPLADSPFKRRCKEVRGIAHVLPCTGFDFLRRLRDAVSIATLTPQPLL